MPERVNEELKHRTHFVRIYSNESSCQLVVPLSDRNARKLDRTVCAHRARILETMNLRNNAELVQYMLTNELV